MKILTCPLNGPRNVTEFAYGGEYKSRPSADASAEVWARYNYIDRNLAGIVYEWWLHIPSAYWFIAQRDTLTDSILRTMSVDAFQAEQSASE